MTYHLPTTGHTIADDAIGVAISFIALVCVLLLWDWLDKRRVK